MRPTILDCRRLHLMERREYPDRWGFFSTVFGRSQSVFSDYASDTWTGHGVWVLVCASVTVVSVRPTGTSESAGGVM